jgi:hypothetical protein
LFQSGLALERFDSTPGAPMAPAVISMVRKVTATTIQP